MPSKHKSLAEILIKQKGNVYDALRFIGNINAGIALALLLYVYGFTLKADEVHQAFIWLDIVFAVFVVLYLLRYYFSSDTPLFFYSSRFEGILLLGAVINAFFNYIFDFKLPTLLFRYMDLPESRFQELYEILITLYLLLLLGLEITRFSKRILVLKVKPAITFILSFIFIIVMGMVLLLLPEMTTKPGTISVIDALFTSASACCVTGLIVVDTATVFTFKGQLVLLGLIQLGGLGIVSFTTFFATFSKSGVGLKHQYVIQEYLSSENLQDARTLLRKIIFITLFIESVGAILVYYSWGIDVKFSSWGQKIFFSIFHAISAFCNAGFSLFTNGLFEVPIRNDYLLHIVIAVIVIMGGLGFPVIDEVFSPSAMRERLQKPWKNWAIGTQIAVYTSIFLILAGTLLFYALERNNTLANLNSTEGYVTSFFQSVVARTAGFNTVDVSKLTVASLYVLIILMFIGASPGSTGGGIKTTTFWLVTVSALSNIRGKKDVEVGRRSIPNEVLFKAFSVMSYSVAFNVTIFFILLIVEPDKGFINLVFEQISAFGTVGTSTGITPNLSFFGKILISITMFVGRVGPVTIALAMSTRVTSTSHKYPSEYVLVG